MNTLDVVSSVSPALIDDRPLSSLLRPAASLFLVMSLLTGVLYPSVVTGIARVLFPAQAAGSLIEHADKIVGSALIGQTFTDAGHFSGRPSATSPAPYNAAASGGSNMGPLNPALAEAVTARIAALKTADPDNNALIPADLVTASASGLDPHISVAAANYQVARIAKARNLPLGTIQALLDVHVEPRPLGLLGEARVNVLQLNIALEAIGKP